MRTSVKRLIELLNEEGPQRLIAAHGPASLVGMGRLADIDEEDDFAGRTMQIERRSMLEVLPGAYPAPAIQEAPGRPETPSRMSIPARVDPGLVTDMVWFIPYSEAPIFLGRTTRTEIPIAEFSISRKHCLLKWTGHGRLEISDCGSTNGVWIDERRLDIGAPVVLKGREGITLGRAQFQFFYAVDLIEELYVRGARRPAKREGPEARRKRKGFWKRMTGR